MTDIFSDTNINNSDSKYQGLPGTPQPAEPPSELNKIVAKYKSLVKKLFEKFYANKKIFWPVSIFFGIVILIVVLGLLFGNKGSVQTPVLIRPTQTPFVRSTPNIPQQTGVLYESRKNLQELKDRIRDFDVKQTKLQPPTINFEVKF